MNDPRFEPASESPPVRARTTSSASRETSARQGHDRPRRDPSSSRPAEAVDAAGEARQKRPVAQILWIDRNPHDIELAQLVLTRLAPHFDVTGVAEIEHLEEAVRGRSVELIVLGDTEPHAARRPGGRDSASDSTIAPVSRSAPLPMSDSDLNSIRRRLRREFPDAPVLLFREASVDDGLRLLREGFDDFLPKSSRSFLELPQFLSKALARDDDRRLRQDRESRVSRLLDYIGVASFRATADGQLREANSAFLSLFGYRSMNQARKADLRELLAVGRRSAAEMPIQEEREITIDGTTHRLRLRRMVLLTPDGEVLVDGLVERLGRSVGDRAGSRAPQQTARPEPVETTAEATADATAEPTTTGPPPVAERDREIPTPPEMVGLSMSERLHLRRSEGTMRAMGTARVDRVENRPPVSLDRVFESIRQELEEPIDRSEAVIRIRSLGYVKGHFAQLVILFRNLVENAIRFRSAQPLRIEVESSATIDRVIVSVRDNGVGMSTSKLRRALGHDRSPPTSATRWSPLGLAISRRIVDHHAGELWAESEPGHGSTFFVSLPRATPGVSPTPGRDDRDRGERE